MRIGLVYPQIEFGSDPVAIRDYAQTAESLGYTHILAYDHVLGANPDRPGGWRGPYTHRSLFMEPFVLFSYMLGFTRKIEFGTNIIILPQRQTALVAKQAATFDVLSGGRFRLGVGLGWNEVEYIALGENFHNRGRRIEEQVALLRELWTKPLVTLAGRWHNIPDAGINPLPVQRPIPIWFGGHAEPVLERAGKLGDGWMTNYLSPEDARPAIEKIEHVLSDNGRDRNGFGFEARLPYKDGDSAAWESTLRGWESLSVTHISVNTMGSGFDSPGQHLEAITRFASQLGMSSS